MVTSAFLSDSGINQISGGGIVSDNIIKTLRPFNLRYILCKQKFDNNKYQEFNTYSINPKDYNIQYFSPFLADYFAFHFIPKENVDLVVTYGCPFGLAMEEYKHSFNSKIICDLPPHNIDISREEHMKYLGSYNHPHLTDDMLWGLYSRHLRWADRVIVHSNKSAEYIQKKAKLKNEPDVIPHGCNIPVKIPDYPENITPGYFGSLGLDKGIIYMVNAWIQLKKEKQFTIGGIEGAHFEIAEKFNKMFNNIGFVENLNDFYKQINFYIQPSVTEGFGITPLEAMAYGRPVIVAEGVGMSDLVTDGYDGFIVPIRDIKAIKEKIQYFYDNPSEIKKMGINARKTALSYGWDTIIKQYQLLYEEVL